MRNSFEMKERRGNYIEICFLKKMWIQLVLDLCAFSKHYTQYGHYHAHNHIIMTLIKYSTTELFNVRGSARREKKTSFWDKLSMSNLFKFSLQACCLLHPQIQLNSLHRWSDSKSIKDQLYNMASHFLRYSVLLQKYRTPLFIASCTGVFAANLFNHVFPNSLFRPLYQAWYKSEPVTLSEKLQDVFRQVTSVFTHFTYLQLLR